MKMTSTVLRALVVSQYADVLQRIQDAFGAKRDVELSLYADWHVPPSHETNHDLLILFTDTPADWLRKLRRQGYDQPALVVTADTLNPVIAPMEADLCPVENVTWEVVRAGGLPLCADLLLSPGVC